MAKDLIRNSTKRGREIWLRQEWAYSKVDEAIASGNIDLYTSHPSIGRTIIDSADWRGAAYRDEIMRCSVIKTSACEGIERHEGKTVYVDYNAVKRWIAAEKLGVTRDRDSERNP